MIQNLDLVINVEESLFSLRLELRHKDTGMFDTLFALWSCDPISCISLCLLSERYAPLTSYELASKIIQLMSFASLNMQMLVKLSQITKLLDMPHYAPLRMQLLKPHKYPYLIHSLKGMLMLLPQGKAFESLKNRLECSSLVFDARQEKAEVQHRADPQLKEKIAMVVNENAALFSAIDREKVMDYVD